MLDSRALVDPLLGLTEILPFFGTMCSHRKANNGPNIISSYRSSSLPDWCEFGVGGLPNSLYEIQSHNFEDKPNQLFSRLYYSIFRLILSKGHGLSCSGSLFFIQTTLSFNFLLHFCLHNNLES